MPGGVRPGPDNQARLGVHCAGTLLLSRTTWTATPPTPAILDGTTHTFIIVDDEDSSCGIDIHASAADLPGKLKWNVAPGPVLFVAQRCPPCDSTMERLIASPMPAPSGFVVKNASNI